ncbi:Metastasis suppressor protein 1 [Clonorchis sinensis]|uniref:Metastasis suppressor protein 1 n=1 Tax=Clonorchis sinensis TaxID=79923 RepID=A0A8T1N0A0_CLOSI|nr:Metastasis suppressor protein 1 [Clonorchis sinensis]
MKSTTVSFSFTSQLANLKNTLALWEDVISKTAKLSVALRTVIQCIASFFEAFQKVADSAYSSNCGLRELGSSMTRFCLRERGLESRLRTFNSQLLECLAAPLTDRLEEWRRTVIQLDRENNKEWRRARNELQRVTCEFDKLNKRFRRKGSVSAHPDSSDRSSATSDMMLPNATSTGDNVQLNFIKHDLELKQRTLAELERVNLRRAVVEERRRFAELITCLKPVLDSHAAIFSDAESIEECISAIGNHAFDPNDLPSDTEHAIDEAVAHVSSQIDAGDRKLSNVRTAMRFGKPPSGLEFQRATLLSGHSSQLSLQSALSTNSTGTSWNAIANAAAAFSLTGNRTTSPHNGSIDMSDQAKFCPQSPSNTSNSLSGTHHAGDSASLFEHADCASAEPTSPNTAAFSIPPLELESTFVPLNDSPKHNKPNSFLVASEDDDGEGATTEDTEDGETEDEERLGASDSAKHEEKARPILYPNQAIPAPVYTNLSELKRAAARRFGETDSPSTSIAISVTKEENGHCTFRPTTPITAPQPSSTANTQPPVQSESGHISSVADMIQVDGFISTPIISGTSTFKRRQSEYGRRNPVAPLSNGLPINATNGCIGNPSGYRPLAYNSVTPGLVRRGSQVCVDGSDGGSRSQTRPANPPRRSSSVSRELTHLRNPPAGAVMDPYAASYHYNASHPSTLSSDGLIDPGIQRVSSSLFTHSSGGQQQQQQRQQHARVVNHNSNTPDATNWSGNNSNRFSSRPNLVQIPPAVGAHLSQYGSVSVAGSSSPNNHYMTNGLFTRPGSNMSALNPPPLATVPAPTQSKTNQLMFGVKVLPNQAPPMGLAASSQYARLPQQHRSMLRQASCAPESLVPTEREAPSMGSPVPVRAASNMALHCGVSSQQSSRTVANNNGNTPISSKEETVTSFID